MIRKEIYPKTKRISVTGDKIVITEKLDGSNLVIFKKDDEFYKRYYMFAKANIDNDYNLYNLIYEHELFMYPFENQEIPKCIGIVPTVVTLGVLPNKNHLDSIYEKYCNDVKRNVEGFVIDYKNNISKYVRMKNGKLVEYSDNDHKGIL